MTRNIHFWMIIAQILHYIEKCAIIIHFASIFWIKFEANKHPKMEAEHASITTTFSLFEFIQMPFGLHNAAQTFQQFIDRVLHNLCFCYVYIDNALIASNSANEHKAHLHQVFK